MATAQLPPIEARLLVAFTNKFLTESVELLNKLCVTSEEKMMQISRKINRIEDSLGNQESHWFLPFNRKNPPFLRSNYLLLSNFGE